MGYGVFIHRLNSIYDDSPAERYQFPGVYLTRVQACVGDWIVYYEPRKVVDTRGYFAVAKVERIVPDPTTAEMYLALIEPGSFLDLSNPVPFKDEEGWVETGLFNDDGKISGRAQAAVRALSPDDFSRIVHRGLDNGDLPSVPAAEARAGGLREEEATFQYEREQNRVTYLQSRELRDRVFRCAVLRAYGERCAISGVKLINGGGHAEVEAAHIRPVEAGGPVIVHNGMALSRTVHWMFNRGLIGLGDDLEVLVSRQANDAESVRMFVNQTGHAFAPHRATERPHPRFLEWHRENCFKH